MSGIATRTRVGAAVATVAVLGLAAVAFWPDTAPDTAADTAPDTAPKPESAAAPVTTAPAPQTQTTGALPPVEGAVPTEAQPADVNLQAGAQLYAENCASCHGADLEGQPDWRTPLEDGSLPAPPHDDSGHTWHHGDPTLFKYVKLGGEATLAQQGIEFNSGMPGFGDSLTDAEIRDILAYIRSTWSERSQKLQAARTEAELAAPDR